MTTTAEAKPEEQRSVSDPPMRAILEALLYASPDPVAISELKEAFGEDRAAEVESALAGLIEEYRAEGRGLMIEQIAGGYRIVSRPDLADVLREFVKRRNRTRLSRAALETLSVIAYRQPVTAPEIEAIRGVNPQAILRSLMDRRLVKMVGRKKVVGKPFLYGTTIEFLQYFGLNSLGELPSMEEFAGILDAMAPPDSPAPATPESDETPESISPSPGMSALPEARKRKKPGDEEEDGEGEEEE